MTNGKKPIEAFALSRVPREQRKSWVDMVIVQAGMVICIPAFLLGSMLAEGMPTLQAMVAGVIGYGMVLVLTLILGIQGADLGIPTCAISTSTFGRKGTRLLVSSLFTVSLVGFFGLQVNVCGEAFSTLALAAFGVLGGKKATVYPGMDADLTAAGAAYTGLPLTIDGNIITGEALGAAIPFALAIARELAGADAAARVKKAIVYQ